MKESQDEPVIEELIESLIESNNREDWATAKSVIEYCGDKDMKAYLDVLDEKMSDNSAERERENEVDSLLEEIQSLSNERNKYRIENKRLSLQAEALKSRLKEESAKEVKSEPVNESTEHSSVYQVRRIQRLKQENLRLRARLSETMEILESVADKLQDSETSGMIKAGEIEALKESVVTSVITTGAKSNLKAKVVGLPSIVAKESTVNVLNESAPLKVSNLIRKLGGK